MLLNILQYLLLHIRLKLLTETIHLCLAHLVTKVVVVIVLNWVYMP